MTFPPRQKRPMVVFEISIGAPLRRGLSLQHGGTLNARWYVGHGFQNVAVDHLGDAGHVCKGRGGDQAQGDGEGAHGHRVPRLR